MSAARLAGTRFRWVLCGVRRSETSETSPNIMPSMADSSLRVLRHRRLLVLCSVVLGTALAGRLYDLGDAVCPEHGERAGEAAACSTPADEDDQTPSDERARIPTTGLPHKGASPEEARVTMLECADFECPFSARAKRSVDELVARNDDLAFYFLHFPLGAFEHGMLKAKAAAAAQRQGAFWPMHDALYTAPIESERDAVELAGHLGLDARRFAADLRDPELAAEVQRQRDLCKNAGVRAVPTFFINGRRVVGARPADDFQRVIDEER